MSLSRVLPDFGSQPAKPSATVVSDVALEDQKLASYEAGYQAGWDDSAASNRDAGNQVSADFAQNMRDLSMTYTEAHLALLKDLKPLLEQFVHAVLPVMARETLGPRLVELIQAEISAVQQQDVILFAAPADCTLIEPMMEGLEAGVNVVLHRDETLASGQVRLGFGPEHEQELDTPALIEGIQNAVSGFFHAHNMSNDDHYVPPHQAKTESA